MAPNRIRRGFAAASAVALVGVVALASSALAGSNTEHPSLIKTQGFDYQRLPTYDVYGYVTSTRKCLANRKVKVQFQNGPSGPFETVDTARTSDKGTWAGSGDVTAETWSIRAVVTRSTYGRRNHRQACGAATSNVVSAAG